MAHVIPSAPLITNQATDRCASFELAAHPGSAAQARRLTRAQLTGWSVAEETCEAATLVVSELVTNAIVHTSSRQIVCELREVRAPEEGSPRGATPGRTPLTGDHRAVPERRGAPRLPDIDVRDSVGPRRAARSATTPHSPSAGVPAEGHPAAASAAGAGAPVIRTGGGARTAGGARLFIAVRDEGCSGVPASPRQNPQDEHGRGLFLVAAVSAAWGTHETEHGSGLVVWAELPREEGAECTR